MTGSSRQASGVPTSPSAIPLHPIAPGSGSGHATDDYVNAIVAFSRRTTGEWLHSGFHFRPFARWLEVDNSRAATPVVDSTGGSPAAPADNFCFAIAVDLQTAEPLSPGAVWPKRHAIRPLRSPSDLDSSAETRCRHSHILFLRGCPSREWVRKVGQRYSIDPEFWRRHEMPFCNPDGAYDLPTLPSFRQDIVQLRVPSIFTLTVNMLLSRDRVVKLRGKTGENRVTTYGKTTELVVGTSLVRGLQAISDSTLVVEQWISCTLVTNKDGWTAVVWLDVGRRLPASLIIPADNAGGSRSADAVGGSWSPSGRVNSVPIIQPTAYAVLDPETSPVPGSSSSGPPTPPTRAAPSPAPAHASATVLGQQQPLLGKQSTTHLPLQYGARLDAAQMRASPLYAVSDVFRHAACSSSQWVNMMHGHVQSAMHQENERLRGGLRGEDGHASRTSEADTLEDLQYVKDLVDEHAAYVGDVVAFFEGGCPAWVRPRQRPGKGKDAQDARGDAGEGDRSSSSTEATLAELLCDFRCLLQRLERLSALCKDSVDVLLSRAQLRESQTAIEKAHEVEMLTLLVFLFAPLSFLSSLYGMNFVNPSSKVALATFLPVAAVVAAVMIMLTKRVVRSWFMTRWRRFMD